MRRLRTLPVALIAAAVLAAATVTTTLPLTAGPAAAATLMDAERRFPVPADTNQVILVRASSWSTTYATVEFFRRSSATSPWTTALPAQPGRLGRSGTREASRRIQGDGTTPAGIFGLPWVFGGAANPGTRLPYRQFDTNAYWPGDPLDPPTFNVYQRRRGSSARWRTSYSEHLADYYSGPHQQYAYAGVLDFNLPMPYAPANMRLGGGIFLHVNGTGSTAGCVSLSRAAMVSTLRWLDPAAKPVIIIGPTTWLDDVVPTAAVLRAMIAPAATGASGTAFTAVARPGRLQWWRLTVTDQCTRDVVATATGQARSPIIARWDGKVTGGGTAPPGTYLMRLESGTTTWTAQTYLVWLVQVTGSQGGAPRC